MDVKMLIAILGVLTITSGQPVPDGQLQTAPNQGGNIVPGVFISSDVLKALQQQAEQNLINSQKANQQPERPNSAVVPESRSDFTNRQPDLSLKINNPPVEGLNNQAQPAFLANQPAVVVNQPISANQQPIPTNQQSGLVNQQPILNSQPQPVLVWSNQQPTVTNQQPFTIQTVPNQPTYFLHEPDQPVPGTPSQNPIVINQPLPNVQQPVYTNQQPNQYVIQNDQLTQLSSPNGQPTLQPSSLENNQAVYISKSVPNSNQNPGTTLYAMIPINDQNNPQNQNTGNGNTYFVPVQNPPPNTNPIYVNSGK